MSKFLKIIRSILANLGALIVWAAIVTGWLVWFAGYIFGDKPDYVATRFILLLVVFGFISYFPASYVYYELNGDNDK